jgi:carbamoyltransferase
LSCVPRGLHSFITTMPIWLKDKLFLKNNLKKELLKIGNCEPNELPALLFSGHHQAHASSAFYPSPFKNAAILCLDGVGEWTTTSAWVGKSNELIPLWEINFPHSLGLLYSAFTYYVGFKVNSGEYKLMGLAPYGEPKYVEIILDNLIDVKNDGTFRLNMRYFNYLSGLTMTSPYFHELFKGPPRKPETELTQRDMDIACSIQVVTEEIVRRLSQTVKKDTGLEFLCLAGGVALNCVANGKILKEKIFKDIWIQPAAGDAGGAVGAALSAWYQYYGKERHIIFPDAMCGALLGPEFREEDIVKYLDSVGAKYEKYLDEDLLSKVADLLEKGKIIGFFHGRMEFGPRALGNRSIIGDPRNPQMQSLINLKIKYRESFRPFAPAVLAERVSEYFDLDRESPYMLLVAKVAEEMRLSTDKSNNISGIEKIKVARSKIAAVTHVDYSARVQTVNEQNNPRFYQLIKKFEERTECCILINTSFNVRGEPIVCTPEDAYCCFMSTEMDFLVLENLLLDKLNQPLAMKTDYWKTKYDLD